ncbi:MAG: septation protein A [Betaproteobacteria bacterium]|nr:septation protein A [Betaproteobacteria bacterium]
MKFLFDLLPVIHFFIAYKFVDIPFATAVAMLTIFIQIVSGLLWRGKVEKMLWVNFAIIFPLGTITILLNDPRYIQWKPTLLYWILSAVLALAPRVSGKNPIRAMLEEKIALPEFVWGRLNFSWAAFFLLLGALNLFVAFHFSMDAWVNFKLFGTTGLMFLFVLVQVLLLSKYFEEK